MKIVIDDDGQILTLATDKTESGFVEIQLGTKSFEGVVNIFSLSEIKRAILALEE